ncbi:MAG: Cytochrome c oxidase polypeptide 4 [Glaciihabitans sp.]|nr:Cytochrome c oxidase polypeptide 4 [Glaciihabitans sp.]
MGANTRLFWVLAGFFLLADIAYTTWNMLVYGNPDATVPTSVFRSPVEWVGTIGLFLSAVLATLIAFYVGRTHRGQGGELPEDRVNANIDDGDAEQGFFSPWSWWPFLLALSAALVFLGVAVGAWISIIGAGIGIVFLVGWTYEYNRGHFGH